MYHDEQKIEAELKAKGKTAPRVTPEMLDNEIVDQKYHVFFGVLTVCVLKLRNGFTVTGESACASPENYDETIGNALAFANARNKIWPFLGFRLKDQLAQG